MSRARLALALLLTMVLGVAQSPAGHPVRAASGVPSTATLSWTNTVFWPDTEPISSSTTTITWDTWLASDRIEVGESVAFQETYKTVLSAVQRYPIDCPTSHDDRSSVLGTFSLIRAPFVPGGDNQFLEFEVVGGTEHTVSSGSCVTTQVKTFTGTIPGSATQGAEALGCWYLTPVGSGPQDQGTFSGTAASVAIGVDPATCTPGNHPPVAVDDGPVVVAAVPPSSADDRSLAIRISPLDNDFDPDGDPIKLVSITAAPDGTTWIDPDDPLSVWYLPNAGFTGDDGFLYTIADDKGLTAKGTIRVSVEGDVPTPTPETECGEGQVATTYLGYWVTRLHGADTLRWKVTIPWCFGNGFVGLTGPVTVEPSIGPFIAPDWISPLFFEFAEDGVLEPEVTTQADGIHVFAEGSFQMCSSVAILLSMVSRLGPTMLTSKLFTHLSGPFKVFFLKLVQKIDSLALRMIGATAQLTLTDEVKRRALIEEASSVLEGVSPLIDLEAFKAWDAGELPVGKFCRSPDTWHPYVNVVLHPDGTTGGGYDPDAAISPFWDLIVLGS